MEHLKEKVKNLKQGENFIFEREDLKKIRSIIQNKKGFLIIAAPNAKYKLYKHFLN
jgi:hypothetical protein